MPETGALIGTPRPSAQASSRTPSPSTRSRSTPASRRRGGSCTGTPRRSGSPPRAPAGRAPVADVPPLRASRMKPVYADRVGREVVVVDVAALLLAGEVVDPLPLLHRAEREQREDLRLALVKSAEPCVRGSPSRRTRRAGSPPRSGRRGAACRPRSSCGRGRCRRPLRRFTNCLVIESLTAGSPSARLPPGTGARGPRGCGRGGRALRRAQLLRVLLRVGGWTSSARNCSHIGPSTATRRAFSRIAAKLAAPGPAHHVVLGRGHRDLGRRRGPGRLVDDRGRLAEPVPAIAALHRLAVLGLELRGEVGVDPLRLPDLLAQVLQRVADLDLGVRELLERLQDDVLRHLVGSCLHHRQRLPRPDDDEVHARLLELLEEELEDELAVDPPTRTAPIGPGAGWRDHQRSGRAVDAEDVVRCHEVRGEDRCR